jgi:hypothetical protein
LWIRHPRAGSSGRVSRFGLWFLDRLQIVNQSLQKK